MGLLIKQHFTSHWSCVLLFGYGEALAIKQKVKYKSVKSNLCSGSDILVYRDNFRGLALMLHRSTTTRPLKSSR